MAADRVIASLLPGFAEEAAEICGKLTHDLLDLERAATWESAQELYVRVARSLHTLKGSSSTVGLESLSRLAHRMEDLLAVYREEGGALANSVTDAFLKALDIILASIQAEAQGRPAEAAVVAQAQALLDACDRSPRAEGEAQQAHAAAQAPELEPVREASDSDGTWRVSVRDVVALMREVERLRELGLRLEQRRQTLEVAVETLRSVEGAGPARDRLSTLRGLLAADSEEVESIVVSAEAELKAIGTVPVQTLVDPLRRTARDLARQLDKQANLAVVGADVALDRRVVEALRGPLLHLVRNAVDHGIETPAQRVRRGKHSEGTIVLRVEQHGNVLFMTVEDDGGGIDVERVRQAALERGVRPAAELAEMTAAQVQQLIFESGFSTRDEVTASSGRGVGLDVVRSQVQALDGRVEVQSVPGQGTRIVLTLPVEFGSSPLLVVRAGEQHFGVPLTAIESVVLAKRDALRTTQSRMQLLHHERLIPLFTLPSLLGQSQPGLPADGRTLLVIQSQGRTVALAVDGINGDQDLVIRSLPSELRELPAYQGAATLADGELLLVLRTEWLVEQGSRVVSTSAATRRALVVDDSLTARALHRTTLEAGGFQVHTASGGAQALELLGQAVYDVVVCDVGMEDMDGYAFTVAARGRPQLRGLPIILVSAHDTDQDRQRGLAAGADGYLSKRDCISGRLVSEVSSLIGRRAAS